MSLSETIDEKYRISVADLGGRAQRLVIANVSYQGVEEMHPVLHFEGLTKRLVLTSSQCYDMIRLTHTAIPSDWIGETIILRPGRSGAPVGATLVVARSSVVARPWTRIIQIDSPSSGAPVGATLVVARFSVVARSLVGSRSWARILRPLAVTCAIAALIAALWAGYHFGDSLLLSLQDWLP